MTTLASVQVRGVLSGLPAYGIPGRLYFASDTGQIYYDTGSGWTNVTEPLIVLLQQQSFVFGVDTGVANAYIVTLVPAPTIVTGSLAVFKAANANTGASTLEVNGTVYSLTKAGSALAAGAIVAGQMVRAIFDGATFQI